MKDFKIGVKLLVSYLVIAFIAAGMGLYLRSSIVTLSDEISEMYQWAALPLSDLVDTAGELNKLRMQTYRLATFEDQSSETRRQILAEANSLAAEIRNGIALQFEKSKTEEGKVILKTFDENVQKYHAEVTRFADEINRGAPPVIPQNLRDLGAKLDEASKKFALTKRSFVDELNVKSNEYESRAKKASVLITIIVVVLAALSGIFMTTLITRPVNNLVEQFKKAEKGDMTARSGLYQKDEIGIVARTADEFFTKLQGIVKELHLHSSTLAGASEELSAVSRELASASEETVNQAATVASTTEQMSVNINTMASGAEEASVNAGEVASAAEEMSVNMDTIATAVEEMGVSISQIASNAGEAHKVAVSAREKADEATGVMSKLGSAAKEIGHVTDVIKKIADKTNLLALNATIEAASAGEAGKGFAVVAGEIKELANQSAQSADDIARRIEGIQHGTSNAIEVITAVSGIIQTINSSVDIIANNVSEQSKAVNEISSNVTQASTGAKRVALAIGEVANGANNVSRNAGEAAKGANHVASNVAAMGAVARESAQGAGQVNQSSLDLSRMATDLKGIVNQFRV